MWISAPENSFEYLNNIVFDMSSLLLGDTTLKHVYFARGVRLCYGLLVSI